MTSRFVRPDTKILKISNDDTLIVRCRLTAGEQRRRFERMSLAGVDGSLKVNRLQVGLSTITAYLLDWSLKDVNDRPVVIRNLSVGDFEAVLDNLELASFNEIQDAIDAHEEAMAAERAAEKNGQGGENKSSAISPSPSGVTGELTGSVS